MTSHQYILEPYGGMKTRYTCPGCGKVKQFTRYIHSETKEHLADEVGRCNREINCGYHYTPKQYFSDNEQFEQQNGHVNKGTQVSHTPISKKDTVTAPPVNRGVKRDAVSHIARKVFLQSRKHHRENCFVQYLLKIFGPETTNQLISQYHIGTSRYWSGATVFWQINTKGDIVSGKIMCYDPDTGCRIKDPFNHVTWVHKVLKLENYQLRQCLFGEHLLNLYPEKTVAIVESEKTAIIASAWFPEMLWIATGGIQNLNEDKLKPLARRTVILFPDLGAYYKWNQIAKNLDIMDHVIVSDFLETKATAEERLTGLDLVDYLVRFDWSKKGTVSEQKEPLEPEKERTKVGTSEDTCSTASTLKKYPKVQELIERLDCEVVREYPFCHEDEKEKEDPSLPLQARARALLDKINLDELSEGSFELTSGVEIIDVNKFVRAQKHLLEHVSPERVVYKKAVERLEGFLKQMT